LAAGDFETRELKALLEARLGAWRVPASQPNQAPPVPSTPLPDFAPDPASIYLVDWPGLTQARAAAAPPPGSFLCSTQV
jgi:hypothetical protein